MQNQYRPQEDKTLKIILYILGGLFGALLLTTCCIVGLFAIGMGGLVLGIIGLIGTILGGLQQMIYGPVPTVVFWPQDSTPPSYTVTTNINPIPDPSATITPTLEPTITTTTVLSETWEWRPLGLYDKLVELPASWTIIEINRRPEPSVEAGGLGLGHDCADYQLIDPGNQYTIGVLMPCTMGDGESAPLCSELVGIEFMQQLSETRYLIRNIDTTQNIIYYGLADYALTWYGTTDWSCAIGTEPYYYEQSRQPDQYTADPNLINRIMISLLTH